MKLKQFFEKYNRQIMIAFFVLFMFKSFQSCNRQSTILVMSNNTEKIQDSLQLKLNSANDTITALKYNLKLAKFSVESAEKRADAIQSTAEKTTRNTTIQIKQNNPTNEKQ